MSREHWLFYGRPIISQNYLHVSDVLVAMRYMDKFTKAYAKESDSDFLCHVISESI